MYKGTFVYVCVVTIMGAVGYFHSVFLMYFIKKMLVATHYIYFMPHEWVGSHSSKKCELISIRMFLVTTELFLFCSIEYLGAGTTLLSNLQVIR